MVSQKDKEEELTRRTLVALNDMRIKFPGKTDDEADYILDKVPVLLYECICGYRYFSFNSRGYYSKTPFWTLKKFL